MKLLAKVGIISLLAGATATAVYGEPEGGWLSPNGQSASGAASASANASVDLRGPMSIGDMHARLALTREQTRADARHIQHLQQIARQAKDVIKLNCVNDKLVQVKPQMNIADSRTADLEAAGDAERPAVFEAIMQASDNIHRLREEADQCIGEPIATGGDSSNSFTGPTAPDDPNKNFPGNELEPPGYASPYN